MPVSIRARLREETRNSGGQLTAGAVILRAIENHANELNELVRKEQAPSEPPSALFPYAASKQRSREEETAIHVVKIAAGNLAVIDELAVQSGAQSRSQLVTAALRADFS